LTKLSGSAAITVRQVLEACVVVAGLSVFIIFGDPGGGRTNAPISLSEERQRQAGPSPRKRPDEDSAGEPGRLKPAPGAPV